MRTLSMSAVDLPLLRSFHALLLALILAGCVQLAYYSQVAQGQYGLWLRERPIDDWLADPATDPELKQRLQQAQLIRRFAVQTLGLPDNGSYKNYAALERPYVLWNVVATPELSLTPLQWCFPIAGCVSYRGYYSKQAALAFARDLRARGRDVQVSGVPAYSTLGWLNDPLLSTFIHYSDAQLARMIFHELAHQLVYVPGDSQFNEAFASMVEEAGVERWLALHGSAAMRVNYQHADGHRQQFLALLEIHRNELVMTYAKKISNHDKRKEKAHNFAALQVDYQLLKANWGGDTAYDRWFAEPLSNANLASIATYQELLPGFRALLAQGQTLAQFYAAVKMLAKLKPAQRHKRLLKLAAPSISP